MAGKAGSARLEEYLRHRVVEVDLARFTIAAVDLGRGELEAMALYKQLGADRLLVDDLRARRIARVNSIQIAGSIGVLLLAKAEGILPLIAPRLELIRAARIRLDDQLVVEALRQAGEA